MIIIIIKDIKAIATIVIIKHTKPHSISPWCPFYRRQVRHSLNVNVSGLKNKLVKLSNKRLWFSLLFINYYNILLIIQILINITIKQKMPNLYAVESGLAETDKILLEGLQSVKEDDTIQSSFIPAKQVIVQSNKQ